MCACLQLPQHLPSVKWALSALEMQRKAATAVPAVKDCKGKAQANPHSYRNTQVAAHTHAPARVWMGAQQTASNKTLCDNIMPHVQPPSFRNGAQSRNPPLTVHSHLADGNKRCSCGTAPQLQEQALKLLLLLCATASTTAAADAQEERRTRTPHTHRHS